MNTWINKGCRSEYVYISFLPQLFPHSLLTTEDFVTEWKLMLGISSFFPSIYMFGFIRRACISLLNPLPLKLVTIWHPQPFSLYLRHGFCSKLDDVEENRVKWICDPVSKKNILKSASFDVMQTVFFAFTCKFGLVL